MPIFATTLWTGCSDVLCYDPPRASFSCVQRVASESHTTQQYITQPKKLGSISVFTCCASLTMVHIEFLFVETCNTYTGHGTQQSRYALLSQWHILVYKTFQNVPKQPYSLGQRCCSDGQTKKNFTSRNGFHRRPFSTGSSRLSQGEINNACVDTNETITVILPNHFLKLQDGASVFRYEHGKKKFSGNFDH